MTGFLDKTCEFPPHPVLKPKNRYFCFLSMLRVDFSSMHTAYYLNQTGHFAPSFVQQSERLVGSFVFYFVISNTSLSIPFPCPGFHHHAEAESRSLRK